VPDLEPQARVREAPAWWKEGLVRLGGCGSAPSISGRRSRRERFVVVEGLPYGHRTEIAVPGEKPGFRCSSPSKKNTRAVREKYVRLLHGIETPAIFGSGSRHHRGGPPGKTFESPGRLG